MLNNGQWQGAWHPHQASDKSGRFLRRPSTVRNWVTVDGRPGPNGKGGFPAEEGRYRLFVALTCPWAHRTLLARALLGLETLIPVTTLSPVLGEQGWEFGGFPGAERDPLFGYSHLHQLYTHHDRGFSGRATVPVLWDTRRKTMVNNESADILRMFNSAFANLVPKTVDLYPVALRPAIDSWNEELYRMLNNGVYRAGFSRSQEAYEEAVAAVFDILGRLEQHLAQAGPYLFGEQLTETDLRLFVTLVRFDLAYHGLFKCNLRRIHDYPCLSGYLKKFYRLPGVAETLDVHHIKAGYYSIRALNPTTIVPAGPELPGWLKPMAA